MTFPGFESSEGHQDLKILTGLLSIARLGSYPSFQRLMGIAAWQSRVTRLAMRLVGKEPLLFFLPYVSGLCLSI